MVFQRRDIIFFSVCVVLSIILILVNTYFPRHINILFEQKNFSYLNFWAHSQGEHSLGYYLGKIEDHLVGPFTNFVEYVLFTIFVFIYLQKSTPLIFFVYVFSFLCLIKLEVLLYPPYGDAIGGPFAEGWWLFKHHFDYLGLLHEPSYALGGARVYFFSLYPTYLALLLKLIPKISVF